MDTQGGHEQRRSEDSEEEGQTGGSHEVPSRGCHHGTVYAPLHSQNVRGGAQGGPSEYCYMPALTHSVMMEHHTHTSACTVVYMYVRMYICTYVFIMYVYMYVCTVHMYVCIYSIICLFGHMYSMIYLSMYVCTVCTYVHMYGNLCNCDYIPVYFCSKCTKFTKSHIECIVEFACVCICLLSVAVTSVLHHFILQVSPSSGDDCPRASSQRRPQAVSC